MYDETGQCIIVDPGCSNDAEEQQLARFIAEKQLTPMMLLLTHAHIDHVLGNHFIVDLYNVPIVMCEIEKDMLQNAVAQGKFFGIEVTPSPDPDIFIQEGQMVTFGNTALEVFHTPGHSPGSLSFYNKEEQYVLSGDVLFLGSVGRTDLPGGDYNILMQSIEDKLLVLDDDVKVYSGHGPDTTIGLERLNNPFIREGLA